MSVMFTVPIDLKARTASGTDRYGNDTYSTVTTTVQGVYAPGGSIEVVAGRDTVTDQPTVYLPAPAPAAIDELTVNGETFEVDGEPQEWPPNPYTGWRPDLPVVIKLKRVSG